MKAVALCFILLPVLGLADFYTSPAEGWLNYNYAAPVKPQAQKKPETPTGEMNAFHVYFENVKNQALMHPGNEQDVENYMALQNYVQNRSVQFQQTWQKVLLDDPQYDYELLHPTDSLANQVEHQATQAEEVAAVKHFAASYGLVFFYYSTDAYAKTMAPSLQSFADQYGIALLGISMDGNLLSAISNNQTDNKGQAYRLGVQDYPALFLVNPQTGASIPVAYGFLAQDQLLQRFYDLETNFSGQDLMTSTGV